MKSLMCKRMIKIISVCMLVICFSAVYANGAAETIPVSGGTIIKYTLTNGIPVYVENTTANKIDSVYIAVKGGCARLTPETSGLESALFTMMARSSTRYNYAARQKKTFDTRSTIGVMAKFTGSALYLGCADYYLDDMLPVLIDGLMHPSYEQTVYDNMMTDYDQSIESMLNDPESLLLYKAVQTVYKGHPYETKSSVTPDSVKSITIDNMKSLYGKIMDASAFFVIAVGRMDGKKLVDTLNQSIGTIPASGKNFSAGDIAPVMVSGDPVVLTHPAAAGAGYIVRIFSAAPNMSDDYVPTLIAANIYSEILYNVVREKYGICYTPFSQVFGSQASLGIDVLYKTTDYKNFMNSVKEAQDIMKQGKVIEAKNLDGSFQLVDLADRIEGYLNTFISDTYASKQTTADCAGDFCYSLLQYGDIGAVGRINDSVKKVTADDVVRVFKKYWVDGSSRWFAIVGPDDVKNIQFK